MKKLLKIPVLFFALMLIVSSCGNETKSDSRNVKDDAKKILGIDQEEVDFQNIEKASLDEQIKLYEQGLEILNDLIETMEYYSENEDRYNDLLKAIKDIDETEFDNSPDLKEFKAGLKVMKEEILKETKRDIKKMKDALKEQVSMQE